jgi:hypothetical protein
LIIVFGFIIRFDHLGASSFVRWLFLNPDCYELMLRFFRASSWNLGDLLSLWAKMSLDLFPAIKFNGRRLIIGDTTKVSKEAKKMPGVKTLRQESQNSGKPEYIRGHHFGFMGLLVGPMAKALCVPLQGELHEGVEQIRPGKSFSGKPATVVTRMAHLAIEKARQTGSLCYVALDAYYSVGPIFQILKSAVNERGERWVHVIVRAKDNYVGYMHLDSPQKRVDEKKKVALADIFDFPHLFKKAELTLYGEAKTVLYYSVDLLWKPVSDLIRFVCVIDGEGRYILMSSDLDLPATEIITIYSYRFKIEVMFFALKHVLGAFCYHFWTKSLPKLGRNKPFDYASLTKAQRTKCNQAIEAVERFVNLGAIALGLLQYLALAMPTRIWQNYQGWLRTYPSDIPSERVVQSVLQAEFFSPGRVPVCRTLKLIRQRCREPALDMAA